MEKILIHIYNFFERRRAAFYACFAISFLLAGWFAFHVKFEEDISKILPQDKKLLIQAKKAL